MKKLVYLFILFAYAFLLSSCSTYQTSPHYAPVKHGRIEYYQIGAGSPIVLIPGYATDISSWSQRFLTALAKQHQLFVVE